MIQRLTGQALLDYVNANPSMSHTERCTGAGYLKELKDGSQGCAFTDFFEAILDAKRELEPDKPSTNWYENLSEQDRLLYDMIEERCPEFEKLDGDHCQEFMDELSDNGITTAQQFENAFIYNVDSWTPEADFARFYAEEIACLDVTNDAGMGSFLVIDWQATWDCNLRHDFFTIEFDGETYFFHNDF